MIRSSFSTVLALAATFAVSAAHAQVAFVNGASFSMGAVAPGAFATVFGQNLCTDTAVSGWIGPRQLPTDLKGCSVTVNGEAAGLSFVSPGQVNFVVPEDAGIGNAQVVIKSQAGTQTGTIAIAKSGPGVFSMNGMGVGKGAFLHGLLWQKGPFSVTTGSSPTPLSLYLTGLDLSTPPMVSVAGVPVKVLWYGPSPQYAGLQQINIELPANMAGVGTVPVTITSGTQTSNVTFVNLLPTTAMMTANPHWPMGKVIADNMRRGRETSSIAFLPPGTTNTVASVLVADEDDDVVRIISLASKETTATITLPEDSEPDHVAVSPDGRLAAAVLPEKASVALIDLANGNKASIIGVGNYPMHVAFAGTQLLVTNHAGRSVSVIDLTSGQVVKTVTVGAGPAGIAVNGSTALVANMQDGTLTAINVNDLTTTTIALPEGSRPFEVAYAGTKAVITMPMSNKCLLYDATNKDNPVTTIDTSAWGAFGPRAIATNGNLVFLANQMSASVAVIDLNADKPAVIKTFAVDPGPRGLAIAGDKLLVLSQAAGVIDVVDLKSYSIVDRIDAEETDGDGHWQLPVVLSLSPATGKQGDTLTMTLYGSNLQGVKGLQFHTLGRGMGMGNNDKSIDSNITVSNVTPNAAGTQVTATVEVKSAAAVGLRVVTLNTDHGDVMGPMTSTLFAVTAKQ